jgi:hypothetical protein
MQIAEFVFRVRREDMRRVRITLASIAIIVAGLTAWTNLDAATVEAMSLDQMAQRAEMI